MAEKTTSKHNVTIDKAANGHLVTYTPEPPSPADLLDMSFEAVMPKFDGEKAEPDPQDLREGLKNMQVRSQNFGYPVKMLYYTVDLERMMDDIQNFVSTGVPPATPSKKD